MYLAFGPDGYIRYGLDDPMAALASRQASFNEYLHNPPWAAEWIVSRHDHRIDGARAAPRSMKPAGKAGCSSSVRSKRGVPVLPVGRCRRRPPGIGRARAAFAVPRHQGDAMDRPAGSRRLAAALRHSGGDVRAAAEPRLLALCRRSSRSSA
jgi:hypothetical protein